MATKKNNWKISEHIQYQIPPLAHTSMYVWHKYWGRKPWNIVSKYIETYCPVGGVVIDPFMGSGVTVIEALRRGRRAIGVDLSPISNEIVRLTILHLETDKIAKGFKEVELRVKMEIEDLYHTACRKCEKPVPFLASACKRSGKDIVIKDIRYECQSCGHRVTAGVKPNDADIKKQKAAAKGLEKYGAYIKPFRLYYNGAPFREKQGYETLHDMFSPRNLLAASILMDAIDKIENKDVRDILRIGFSSMIHLCTTMMPVRETRDVSGCWTQHSYWYAQTFLDQNVWNKFESAICGRQGVIKAKEESNKLFKNVKFGRSIDDVISGKADVFLACESAITVLDKIKDSKNSVQYCFTDPPYNGSIQYGELSFLWAAWLGYGEGYVRRIKDDEVVENDGQKKDFEIYHTMLRKTLRGIFDILDEGSYCHLTFTNPKTKYRNMTLNSAMFAGFEFEEIHHQEGARSSAKALLQPFGSVNGDFYLRFRRNSDFRIESKEQISEKRFESVVVNTSKKVILSRGEPTPFTSIIEEVDKALYNEGFYIETVTNKFSVEKALKNNVGSVFKLVDANLGGVKGKLWWLDKPEEHKFGIPLDERVEAVVIDQLKKNYEVTFTDIWEQVGISFPNSLTPDTSNIKKSLEEYAAKTKKGGWRLKPILLERYTQHSEMIHILAKLGQKMGYNVHVGRREQRDSSAFFGKQVKLKDLCSEEKPRLEKVNADSLNPILNIDLLWYKNGIIPTSECCF